MIVEISAHSGEVLYTMGELFHSNKVGLELCSRRRAFCRSQPFLTLCGYDTFDIMRRNFKRISGGSASAPVLDAYWEAKQEAEQAQRTYQFLLKDLSECEDAIATCEADIAALEKVYGKTP